MISHHPELEELILWQSGELGPDEAADVAAHLAACRECQAELTGLESLKERVVRVNTLAAKRSFHAAFEKRSMARWRGVSMRLFAPRLGMAVVASILIAALVLFSLNEFTPEARADTLLARAEAQQRSEAQTPHLLRAEGADIHCRLATQPQGTTVRAIEVRNQPACQALTGRFRTAGWTGNDLLSARAFQHWRKALRRKRDSIHKLTDAVEVTTRSEEGPIRAATLRLRFSDYHPVYGKFEFAADLHQDTIEVTETALDAPEVAVTAPPAPEKTSHPSVIQPHIVDPLDMAEAETRLALHRAGVDRSVLIAVEREPADIKVWGVAPSETIRQEIANALSALPGVKDTIEPEAGQQGREGSLPWQAYRGDAPPLGFDALQSLYPSDIEGRQKFLNDLDTQTRQLVAEARSRDALLALASHIQPADAAQAAQLKQAASELELEMMTDLSALRDRLQPLAGTATGHAVPLNAGQAMRLYLLVHKVLFQAKSSDSLDLGTALGQIRGLIGG